MTVTCAEFLLLQQDFVIENKWTRCKKHIPLWKRNELSHSAVPHIQIEHQLQRALDWPLVALRAEPEQNRQSLLIVGGKILNNQFKKAAKNETLSNDVEITHF